MSKVEEIASTVLLVMTPGMKPKELRKAVEAAHPKASKKDVARAAFYAMIAVADKSPEAAQVLHDAGLTLRVGDDEPAAVAEEAPKAEKPAKKKTPASRKAAAKPDASDTASAKAEASEDTPAKASKGKAAAKPDKA